MSNHETNVENKLDDIRVVLQQILQVLQGQNPQIIYADELSQRLKAQEPKKEGPR